MFVKMYCSSFFYLDRGIDVKKSIAFAYSVTLVNKRFVILLSHTILYIYLCAPFEIEK